MLEATALWWRIQLDPESRALDAAFSASVERAIRTTEAWTERSRRTRGVVLPGRRLRARGCSGACCATKSSRPRATANDQAGARTRDRARAGPGRRVFRARDVQVLRRRRAGGGQDPEVPAAAARRRSRRRAARDAARTRRAAGCSRARRTTSCTSSISGTSSSRAARSSCCTRCRLATRAIRCSGADRRHSGRLPARHHREPRDVADAARRRARAARQQRRAGRSAGPARGRAACSRRSTRPTTRSSTCGR